MTDPENIHIRGDGSWMYADEHNDAARDDPQSETWDVHAVEMEWAEPEAMSHALREAGHDVEVRTE